MLLLVPNIGECEFINRRNPSLSKKGNLMSQTLEDSFIFLQIRNFLVECPLLDYFDYKVFGTVQFIC